MRCPRCKVDKPVSDTGFTFRTSMPFRECDPYSIYDCEDCEITFRWERGQSKLEIKSWNREEPLGKRLQHVLNSVSFPVDDDWERIYAAM